MARNVFGRQLCLFVCWIMGLTLMVLEWYPFGNAVTNSNGQTLAFRRINGRMKCPLFGPKNPRFSQNAGKRLSSCFADYLLLFHL